MDTAICNVLSKPDFQQYLIKKYLKTQLEGMIRIFQSRYPSYITYDQMQEEICLVDKLINRLSIDFTNNIPAETTTVAKKKQRKMVEISERCHARIWDSNNLVWQLNGKTVYGNQCKNPKSPKSGHNYCKKHEKKLTHEDWFVEPTDRMRMHFIKSS